MSTRVDMAIMLPGHTRRPFGFLGASIIGRDNPSRYIIRPVRYRNTYQTATEESMENTVKSAQLHQLEEKFYKACDQIVMIDRKLQDITLRYNHANEEGHRSMRYNRRLQLVTLEGVRAAFYQFAELTANKMTELRCELFGDEVLLQDEYDSDC